LNRGIRISHARRGDERRSRSRRQVTNELTRSPRIDKHLYSSRRHVLRMRVFDAVSVGAGSWAAQGSQCAVVIACIASRLRKYGWLRGNYRKAGIRNWNDIRIFGAVIGNEVERVISKRQVL